MRNLAILVDGQRTWQVPATSVFSSLLLEIQTRIVLLLFFQDLFDGPITKLSGAVIL